MLSATFNYARTRVLQQCAWEQWASLRPLYYKMHSQKQNQPNRIKNITRFSCRGSSACSSYILMGKERWRTLRHDKYLATETGNNWIHRIHKIAWLIISNNATAGNVTAGLVEIKVRKWEDLLWGFPMQGEFLVGIGSRDIHNHILLITNKKKHSQRNAGND